MSRLECLHNKYELAKSNFQAGDTSLSVSPYFWSIYSNGRVKESHIPSQAVAENPTYIISAYVNNYMYYGQRREAYLICYQNIECDEYNSSISLNTWSITKIKLFNCDLIDGATFELVSDYTQSFTFHFDSSTVFRSMQMLWTFFLELDANCSNVKEAEFYYKFYLQKLELQQTTLTLDQYRIELEEQKDLTARYADLLNNIQILVTNREDGH